MSLKTRIQCQGEVFVEPNPISKAELREEMATRTGVCGYVRLVVRDKDGILKHDTGWNKNNFTNAGKAACAGKMSGAAVIADFDYLAVGSSNQAEADADTALISEITGNGLARAQDASPTRSTTTVTNDTMEINYSWSVSGTETVYEIGVFNASAAGDMIGRSVLGASVGVINGDTLNGLYKVIFA